jgi:hypothetical protein
VDALATETIEAHPIIATARTRIVAAASDLLAIQDAALERGAPAPSPPRGVHGRSDDVWPWQGEEADVRYGFFHAYEQLEAASSAVARGCDEAGSWPAPGARRAATATVARWDLHARLLALADDDLDRDPGGGEWNLRQTLAHIINGQRAYGHYTAWWLLQRGADPFPDAVPDAADVGFPDEATEGEGSLPEIRARLDAVLDELMSRMGGLGDDDLAARARWSGLWVDVGFRIGRWASHLREHTVQVDKTLVMLSWTPREVDRLVGLVVGAYGRLEAQVFGLPPAALDRPGADGRTAAGLIDEVTSGVEAVASSVREAARG